MSQSYPIQPKNSPTQKTDEPAVKIKVDSKAEENRKNVDEFKKDVQKGKKNEGDLRASSKLLGNLEEAEGDSAFEKLVKKVLKGKEIIVRLAKSQLARFSSKNSGTWNQFFNNVAQRGSVTVNSQLSSSSLTRALFRGSFQQGAKGSTVLVADLSFLTNGKTTTHKFSRLSLSQAATQTLTTGQSPGDTLALDQMKKLGEQLQYTRLAHQPNALSSEAQEAASEAMMNQLKGQLHPSTTSKLEQALVEERQKRQGNERAKSKDAHPSHPFWGNTPNEKEPRLGKPRLWLAVGAAAVISLGLILLVKLYQGF